MPPYVVIYAFMAILVLPGSRIDAIFWILGGRHLGVCHDRTWLRSSMARGTPHGQLAIGGNHLPCTPEFVRNEVGRAFAGPPRLLPGE